MGLLALKYDVDTSSCSVDEIISWFNDLQGVVLTQKSFRPFLERVQEERFGGNQLDFRVNPSAEDGGLPGLIHHHMTSSSVTNLGPNLQIDAIAKELCRLEDVGMKNLDVWEGNKSASIREKLKDFESAKTRAVERLGVSRIETHTILPEVTSDERVCVLASFSERLCRFKFVWGNPRTDIDKEDRRRFEETGELLFSPWVTQYRRVTVIIDVLPELEVFLVRHHNFKQKGKDAIIHAVFLSVLSVFGILPAEISRRGYVEELKKKRASIDSNDLILIIEDEEVRIRSSRDQNVAEPGANRTLGALEKTLGVDELFLEGKLRWNNSDPSVGMDRVVHWLDARIGKFKFSDLGEKPEEAILYALRRVDEKVERYLLGK